MKYVVTIGGKRVEVERVGDTVRVDGGPAQRAQLSPVGGRTDLLLRLGDAPHEVHRVTARREDARGTYVLEIHGRRFTAEALDERTRAILDQTAAHAGPKGPASLVAPMPGLIVRIDVAVGDVVQAGQGAIVMEAMKMENELRVQTGAKVSAVHVRVGQAVEKGTILVQFEGTGVQGAVRGTSDKGRDQGRGQG